LLAIPQSLPSRARDIENIKPYSIDIEGLFREVKIKELVSFGCLGTDLGDRLFISLLPSKELSRRALVFNTIELMVLLRLL